MATQTKQKVLYQPLYSKLYARILNFSLYLMSMTNIFTDNSLKFQINDLRSEQVIEKFRMKKDKSMKHSPIYLQWQTGASTLSNSQRVTIGWILIVPQMSQTTSKWTVLPVPFLITVGFKMILKIEFKDFHKLNSLYNCFRKIIKILYLAQVQLLKLTSQFISLIMK